MRAILATRWHAGAVLLVAVELAVACALAIAVTQPAAAQFFDDRYRFPFFDNRRRQQAPQWPWQYTPEQRREPVVDASKAPAPRRHETAPTMRVVVVGDSMADWLGYGLDEAFAESPEIGVTRKVRANRGLIKIETRSDPYDAVAAVREFLMAEKADFVVMMVGLADRQSIRERHVRAPAQPRQANPPAGPQAQPPGEQPPRPPGDAEMPTDEQPTIIAPEPAPSGVTVHEFRSEKWADLYGKRIDEIIAILKAKGVPVFWVGLPPIRGTRSTADMVYLNDLYRSRAEKAGIIYVDVWDGFVDESGNFAAQGPDFEGQTRRLRAQDGVHFTKAGARKLAHYLEREIRRVMQARATPMAMPAPDEKEQPVAPNARPGAPAPRPVAGPVVPLTTGPAVTPEGLLGSGPSRTPTSDPLVNRVLVRGEPVAAPKGRADDFVWPRPDGLPTTAVGPTEPNAEPPRSATTPTRSPASAPNAKQPSPTTAPAPAKRAHVRPAPPLAITRDDLPRPPGSIPNASTTWPSYRNR